MTDEDNMGLGRRSSAAVSLPVISPVECVSLTGMGFITFDDEIAM